MEEKDKSMESLLTHVHSLQDEVQQLSGLYHQHGNDNPIISDLVRERGGGRARERGKERDREGGGREREGEGERGRE